MDRWGPSWRPPDPPPAWIAALQALALTAAPLLAALPLHR